MIQNAEKKTCLRADSRFLQLSINLSEALEMWPISNQPHSWLIDRVCMKNSRTLQNSLLRTQNKVYGPAPMLSHFLKNIIWKTRAASWSNYCLIIYLMLNLNYVQLHMIYRVCVLNLWCANSRRKKIAGILNGDLLDKAERGDDLLTDGKIRKKEGFCSNKWSVWSSAYRSNGGWSFRIGLRETERE